MESLDPDIIVGTESKLTSAFKGNYNELFPPGYTAFTNNKGLGIFILVKDVIPATLIEDLSVNASAMLVQIKIKGQKLLHVVAFYGSPSEKGCSSFENLDNILSDLQQKNRDQHDVWLCGDFNLPDVNWESHQVMAGATRPRQSEAMLEICHKFSLDQIQLEPTRITRTIQQTC